MGFIPNSWCCVCQRIFDAASLCEDLTCPRSRYLWIVLLWQTHRSGWSSSPTSWPPASRVAAGGDRTSSRCPIIGFSNCPCSPFPTFLSVTCRLIKRNHICCYGNEGWWDPPLSCLNGRAQTHAHTGTCTHIHTHMHTHTCTHAHTGTYTHTHTSGVNFRQTNLL